MADQRDKAKPSAPGGGSGRRAVIKAGAAAGAGLALASGYLGASGSEYLQPLGSDYLQPRVTSVALVEVAYASGSHVGTSAGGKST